jgi:acyl carrier protein
MTTASRSSTVDLVRHVVDSQLNFAVHGYQLQPADDLWTLGMTSLTCVGLMLAIEDAFEIELPESLLNESTFRSINAVAAAVESALLSTSEPTAPALPKRTSDSAPASL